MLVKKMILKYLISVVTSLNLIHVGSFAVKLKASFKMAFLISIPYFTSMVTLKLLNVWDRLMVWFYESIDYILIVFIAIIIDHALGTIRHLWFDRDFSIKKNLFGLVTKVALVVGVGILFEGLNVILDKESIIADYLTTVCRLMVFLYPAGSAFGNSAIVSKGKFPPESWLEKLKKFQENLNPNDLNKKNEE